MIHCDLHPRRPIDCSRDFRLTDAIRPSAGEPYSPREGYRLETYQRRSAGPQIPVLAANVSRERLFDAFLHLLEPLGDEVDVVLETSHGDSERHRDLRRKHIDRPVLESYFHEFEELLLNDGFTGVAVMATRKPMEVQFDEHKTLICYARDLRPFRAILHECGIHRRDQLPLIFDFQHLHYSRPHHVRRFDDLAWRLGVGAEADMVAG